MNTITIDKTIYTARPSDERSREEKEILVYNLLEKLDIPFQRIDHDPTMTVESCLEVEKLLDIQICKNLFLTTANQSEFYLYMLPGDKRFQTRIVSDQIGSSRLSFANEDYMEQYLNITPGSVSVLGLMNDKENKVHLLLDQDILKQEYVGCHPCINTSSLKIKTKDLLNKFLPYTKHDYKIINFPNV